MLHKLLFLTLLCSTFHKIKSTGRHHAVVDMEQDGPHFRGKVHVNGNSRDLKLQSPESSVFAPNFRLTEAVMSPEGKLYFRDISTHQHPSELEENIYVDEDANASFRVEHVNGEIRMHGMMDNIHISHDGQNYFAIVHDVPALNFTRDYLPTELEFTEDISVENRQIVTAHPELYIWMDMKVYEALKDTPFGGSDSTMSMYLSVLVRGVNNRYKTFSDPSITFKVVGATVSKTKEAQPFIEANRKGEQTSMARVLNDFSEYMRSNAEGMPPHDLAPLISGEDYGGNLGLAWLNGVCRDGYGNKSLRTSVSVDEKGVWSGIQTLAHELGHSMGAPHDGDEARLCNATKCPWESGYIMTYTFDPVKSLTFSECSKNCMKTLIKTKEAACVRESDPKSRPWPEASINPGTYLSMEQQCQRRMGRSDAKPYREYSADQLCGEIACEYPTGKGGYKHYKYQTHALDGTACGTTGKKCQEGRCV